MTVVRPASSRILELPAGNLDDPAGQAGLAALIAAVLGDPRCGGLPARAAAQGWRTRHQLEERWSTFAFWSPRLADPQAILDEARRTCLPAGARGETLLAAMRSRHLAAPGKGAAPFALIGRALEQAAVGELAAATPETVAAVTVSELAEKADGQLARARVYPTDSAKVTPEPRAADSPFRPWAGRLVTVVGPGSEAVVGVRQVVRDASPEVLDTMVEVLGNGPDGRLQREVRHRHHLAYGFTAAVWRQPGFAAIGATATVPPDFAAAAVRVLSATLRRLADGAGPRETAVARRRARSALLATLDGPFGAADDARRQAHGQQPARTRLARMAELMLLPGLRFVSAAPAVAAVGPFERQHLTELTRAYEEIACLRL